MKTLIVYLLGFASALYGLWEIYHPAAFIVGGILLIIVSMFIDRHEENSK